MNTVGEKLTYANVMATIAVVIALGTGSSYALEKLDGRQLENRSVPGKKLKRNTLTGKEIRESRLGQVPRATFAVDARRAWNAKRLNGRSEASLLVACPGHTHDAAGVCIDRSPRRGGTYRQVIEDCNTNQSGHLPTHDQLLALVSRADVELSSFGEYIAPVVLLPDGTPGIGVMTDESGSTSFVPITSTEQHVARCVFQVDN